MDRFLSRQSASSSGSSSAAQPVVTPGSSTAAQPVVTPGSSSAAQPVVTPGSSTARPKLGGTLTPLICSMLVATLLTCEKRDWCSLRATGRMFKEALVAHGAMLCFRFDIEFARLCSDARSLLNLEDWEDRMERRGCANAICGKQTERRVPSIERNAKGTRLCKNYPMIDPQCSINNGMSSHGRSKYIVCCSDGCVAVVKKYSSLLTLQSCLYWDPFSILKAVSHLEQENA